MKNNENGDILIGAIGFALIMCVIFTSIYAWAYIRLWKAEYVGKALAIEKKYKGQAILEEAKFAKQARIEAAKAEKDSAALTAEAIEIVGAMAKKYPEYRQQEFYLALGEALQNGSIQQILYIPTEAGLPITEAGKRAE